MAPTNLRLSLRWAQLKSVSKYAARVGSLFQLAITDREILDGECTSCSFRFFYPVNIKNILARAGRRTSIHPVLWLRLIPPGNVRHELAKFRQRRKPTPLCGQQKQTRQAGCRIFPARKESHNFTPFLISIC